MLKLIYWAIGNIGKIELMKVVWKIFRKIFDHLYDEVIVLVDQAQRDMPDATGTQKAKFVFDKMLDSHNELSEFKWVINILIEVAVTERKGYNRAVKTLPGVR